MSDLETKNAIPYSHVWIKTKDDGKANITEHCPLSFEEVIERCYLTSSKPKDEVLLINLDKQKSNKKFTYVTIYNFF